MKPTFLGTASFDDYDLAELVPYIDWTPFFQTWELAGRFPAILDDAVVGEAARALYDDAREMLERIVEEKWFRARAVVGFWPANARRRRHRALRRREPHQADRDAAHAAPADREARGPANAALADFVAPVDRACADYVGGFAVTAGHRRGRDRRPLRGGQRRLLRRSCARRSPTAWPRPSPSACTSACAASSGATRRTRRSRPTI